MENQIHHIPDYLLYITIPLMIVGGIGLLYNIVTVPPTNKLSSHIYSTIPLLLAGAIFAIYIIFLK